jgi:ABC-type molybdate transport system permease subunit
MSDKRGLPRALVVSEFRHTYGRHGGRITVAAPILGMTPTALSRALYRARKDGERVEFFDDVKVWRNQRDRGVA